MGRIFPKATRVGTVDGEARKKEQVFLPGGPTMIIMLQASNILCLRLRFKTDTIMAYELLTISL